MSRAPDRERKPACPGGISRCPCSIAESVWPSSRAAGGSRCRGRDRCWTRAMASSDRPRASAACAETDVLGPDRERPARGSRRAPAAGLPASSREPPARSVVQVEHVAATEEARDERGPWPAEDSLGAIALHDMAEVEDGDPVAHRQRLLLVVRDVDEGRRGRRLDLAQLGLHLAPDLLVERRERLVQQQNLRLWRQRAGDRHPLLLAARERLGTADPRTRPAPPAREAPGCAPRAAHGQSRRRRP